MLLLISSTLLSPIDRTTMRQRVNGRGLSRECAEIRRELRGAPGLRLIARTNDRNLMRKSESYLSESCRGVRLSRFFSVLSDVLE